MNNTLLSEAFGVYYLDMDTAVEEQISFNSDGSFSIFINVKLNYERQMLAYQHAIQHIMQNDFSKADADEIERAMCPGAGRHRKVLKSNTIAERKC